MQLITYGCRSRWLCLLCLCQLQFCAFDICEAQDPAKDKAALAKAQAEAEFRAQLQIRVQNQTQARERARPDVVTVLALRNQSEQQLKSQFAQQAQRKIDYLRTLCDLSPKQIEKLKLAADGDITRLINSIAVMRHQTQHLSTSIREDSIEASRTLQPLRLQIAEGPFVDDSLFVTTLETTLDEQQKRIHQQTLRDKLQKRERALAMYTVAMLEEVIVLRKEQREKLIKMLEGKPSRQLSPSLEPFSGYYRLMQTSDAELSEVLDADQFVEVRKICEEYRSRLPALP